MSDYHPSPDELRDAWINDYDAGMPPDISECSSDTTKEKYTERTDDNMEEIKQRLEYLRGELRAQRISWGELAELESLAPHINSSDVELLEAAGVPEFEDDRTEATCEWFDSLPKPPEPLPWIEAPKATDQHPFA